MRRVLFSIGMGIVWFAGIGVSQHFGAGNPEWFYVASTAGATACVGAFLGYGIGKKDSD